MPRERGEHAVELLKDDRQLFYQECEKSHYIKEDLRYADRNNFKSIYRHALYKLESNRTMDMLTDLGKIDSIFVIDMFKDYSVYLCNLIGEYKIDVEHLVVLQDIFDATKIELSSMQKAYWDDVKYFVAVMQLQESMCTLRRRCTNGIVAVKDNAFLVCNGLPALEYKLCNYGVGIPGYTAYYYEKPYLLLILLYSVLYHVSTAESEKVILSKSGGFLIKGCSKRIESLLCRQMLYGNFFKLDGELIPAINRLNSQYTCVGKYKFRDYTNVYNQGIFTLLSKFYGMLFRKFYTELYSGGHTTDDMAIASVTANRIYFRLKDTYEVTDVLPTMGYGLKPLESFEYTNNFGVNVLLDSFETGLAF